MKKILSLIIIVGISLWTFSLTNAALSTRQQNNYKKQIDKVMITFDKWMEKLEYISQINNIETIKEKIKVLQKTSLSDANKFVVEYLDDLLSERLKEINDKIIVKECYVEYWKWYQTYANNVWSECKVVSCDDWKYLENNACTIKTKTCTISHWTGEQIWDWNSWSDCIVKSCNSGYEINNWKCSTACISWMHKSDWVCVDNIASCYIENWAGQKEWKNWVWWECLITSCNDWYTISKDYSCEKPEIKAIVKNTNKEVWNYWIITTIEFETDIDFLINSICFVDTNNTRIRAQFDVYFNGEFLSSLSSLDNKICPSINAKIRTESENKIEIEVRAVDRDESWKIPFFTIERSSTSAISLNNNENLRDVIEIIEEQD